MAGIQIDGANQKLYLDSDADTYFEAATDDTIKIYIAGAQDFTLTANTLTAESGSTIAAQALTSTTVTASGIIKTDDTTAATSTTDGSLQTDGGLSVALDAIIGDDVTLITDSAVLGFGADKDTTLTHTDGTGLTLNSTNKLCFNDVSQFVQGISGTVLGLGATDEIDLTATAVDLNGTLDVSGTSQFNAAVTLAGTTPSLTIGDAGAEDTKIVFDGNAQDFYIGLDDSEDDLVIGLGSTVGTTAHVIIDETGAMTKPLQPAFFATKTGATANQTGDGTAYTFAAFTERYDQNADFNATTGTFTAPVTGRYLFQCLYALYTIDSDHTWVKLYINASNSSQYTASLGPYAMRGQSGDGYFYFPGCITHDMDAADTCTMVATVSGGSATIDPQPSSWFSGHLIC